MTAVPLLADGVFDLPPGKIACVVTHLEMRRAPLARLCPDERVDLQLRRVFDPQPDWYRTLFRRVGEAWLWSSRLLLGDASLSAILSDPAVEIFVLEHEGGEKGLLELDFRVAGLCEIAFFGLVPALVGRGAGRWLMDQALARAWAQPVTRVWLHTCTVDHPAALPFYLRSGFVAFGQQVEVADDPRRLGLHPLTVAPHIPAL